MCKSSKVPVYNGEVLLQATVDKLTSYYRMCPVARFVYVKLLQAGRKFVAVALHHSFSTMSASNVYRPRGIY